MMKLEEKTFYFKIDGRVYAKTEGEATDYLFELLRDKVEMYRIVSVKEVE
jgi:hypothetical protein